MIGRGAVLIAAPLSGGLAEALGDRYGATEVGDEDPARVRVLVTTGGRGADPALVDRLPALGLIAVQGVGYDRVDLGQARARGIAVTTTPGVLTDDVADLAVGLLYAAARRIAANDRFVREGRWAAGEHAPFGARVTGRAVGILGLGRIGSAVAARLAPVAGRIGYHNRRPVPGSALPYHPSAAALAAASSVLIVTTSTRAGDPPIVDDAVLAALGPGGILVNVARGSAVDEAALAERLADGRLLAAGLDVFADEPQVHPTLLALPNAVLQPHMGSATPETRAAMAAMVLAAVEAFDRGTELPGRVA